MTALHPATATQDCSGFCRHCNTYHRLPADGAMQEALRLMRMLDRRCSIDLFDSGSGSSPDLSTAALFGSQRGKMFGVLQCLNRANEQVWLYGFSGQYNGRWLIPGWAPPLFDAARFKQLHDPAERKIKELGRQIEQRQDADHRKRLLARRTELSRRLMQQIHELYTLNNFSGQSATLDEVLGTAANKPTGIGDCCGPKLLNRAALLDLTPISLAEFYFGRENLSKSRKHGHFYPPCEDKCKPLLGFLLCGAASD